LTSSTGLLPPFGRLRNSLAETTGENDGKACSAGGAERTLLRLMAQVYDKLEVMLGRRHGVLHGSTFGR
jgi:hypothetical protein